MKKADKDQLWYLWMHVGCIAENGKTYCEGTPIKAAHMCLVKEVEEYLTKLKKALK